MNEKRIIQRMTQTRDIAGAEMILPNTSGDHVKSIKRQTPVADADLVNKKYVDDQIATLPAIPLSHTNAAHLTNVGTNTHAQIDTAITASTNHIADNTQAHSDYMLNTGDTATGDYTFDSGTLYINSTTHRVGIGATGAGAKLHVYGTTAAGTIGDGTNIPDLHISSAHGADTKQTVSINNSAGTRLLTLTGAGKFGIGTASPTNQLTVAGSITLSAAGGTFEAGSIFTDANWGFLFRPRVAGTSAAHTFMNSAGDAHRLTILDAGNVGIGTTTPGNKLTVVASTGAMAYFGGNDANNWISLSDNNGTNTCNYGVISGGNAYIYTLGYISFYPGGANWIRFTADGDAGFGITTPDARVEIETQSDEGAQALTIDQNDDDVAFVDFQGTSAADATKNISTAAITAFTYTGMIKIEVNGTAKWIPYYTVV